MSDQARENVYQKSGIHRRSEGVPWEDDGFTLNDRKKRLSRTSWTAL